MNGSNDVAGIDVVAVVDVVFFPQDHSVLVVCRDVVVKAESVL